ncbi:MAG: ubiquitin-conjugating enzyme E2 variant [Candidatus Hodarchaeales archaeon]|jgi:ubiquitin-conjugating enzyme E2 N
MEIDPDLMLAREAQLVYSNVEGWNPAGNNLRSWRGIIRNNRTGDVFTFEVFLPNYFPNVPPVVRAITDLTHPNVDNDLFVALRILENWRSEFHLYQVVNALRALMTRVPPIKPGDRPREVPPVMQRPPVTQPRYQPVVKRTGREIPTRDRELERLRDEVQQRDEELAKIRATQAIKEMPEEIYKGIKVEKDTMMDLESDIIAVSELLSSLEEKYAAGDISIFEYTKQYKKYSKQLYILKKKIEHARSS